MPLRTITEIVDPIVLAGALVYGTWLLRDGEAVAYPLPDERQGYRP
jgi:hypothetical protein